MASGSDFDGAASIYGEPTTMSRVFPPHKCLRSYIYMEALIKGLRDG